MYLNRKQLFLIVIFHNITVFILLLIKNAAFVSIIDFFKKQKPHQPQTVRTMFAVFSINILETPT